MYCFIEEFPVSLQADRSVTRVEVFASAAVDLYIYCDNLA